MNKGHKWRDIGRKTVTAVPNASCGDAFSQVKNTLLSERTEAPEIGFLPSENCNDRGIPYPWKVRYDRAISEFTRALEMNPRIPGLPKPAATVGTPAKLREDLSNFDKALEMSPSMLRRILRNAKHTILYNICSRRGPYGRETSL
jgi:hypothetical protein